MNILSDNFTHTRLIKSSSSFVKYLLRFILWIVASLIGLIFAGIISVASLSLEGFMPFSIAIGVFIAGGFVGFCQWSVLYESFPRSYWWIITTAFGWLGVIGAVEIFLGNSSLAFWGRFYFGNSIISFTLISSLFLVLLHTISFIPFTKYFFLWFIFELVGYGIFFIFSLFSFGMSLGHYHVSDVFSFLKLIILVFGYGAIGYSLLTAPIYLLMVYTSRKKDIK